MVFCGPLPITFHLIGSMRQTKEQILSYLGEHFADTLVECVEYVHQQQITADDVAKLVLDELEDWMAYHIANANAAESIRHAIRERVS